MKKFLFIGLLILLTSNCGYCATDSSYTTSNLTVFTKDNKYFGLKDSSDKEVVAPVYKKLIRLGTHAWIIQKHNKYGLMDCNGNILVQPKYLHVERLFDTWVKLGNERDYGLYDEYGKIIIPPKFNNIEPLFGKKFLTYRNFKYGIYNEKGEMILDNICEFIYMPNPKTVRIKYDNQWFEAEKITTEDALKLSEEDNVQNVDDSTFKITKIFTNTGVGAGYSDVTTADYTLKALSSLSNAYEETIDELLLSQGVETVSIFMKVSWLPKFPIVFIKKYYNNIVKPNNGPLAETREKLLNQIK
jgi:hypothetical protein